MSQLNDHSSRSHALLSASSAHRWLSCPSSAVAAEMYPDQHTDFTREGTLAHELAEVAGGLRMNPYGDCTTAAELFRNDIPKGYTQEMVDHADAYADYIQEQITTHDAVVLLEERVDFSPWVEGGFGTCDCLILQDGVLTIIDYKYGQGVPVSAEDNPQMKLYALGALNDYGFAYSITRVEMHIYQPRLNNISTCSLMVEDLLEWAEQTVKPIAAKAAKGEGGWKAGSWCKFCPHAGQCPTLTQTCTEYVETHDLRVAVPVLSPHEVAEVLEMEPLVTLWLKRVKTQALDSLMDGKEIPGWKVVEGKQGNRKWKDELETATALLAAGYAQEDITETKLLSPAAMDKFLGKKKAAELLADMVDRSPGTPTVVPASDKRPPLDRLAEAKEDFA